MFELLLSKVKEKIDLSDAQLETVKSFFQPKKLRRKHFLLNEGEPARYVAFVEKGLLRSYTVDDKGAEHIVQFAFEGWWITDNSSFYTGAPSMYHIDALEDSELLLLSQDAEQRLMVQIPEMEKFFRLLLLRAVVAMQQRLVSQMTLTAEKKYERLLQIYPDISQRVPLHMMASFMGITPETLSRVRKQMTRSK